jgi:hypothetical protein
VLVLVTCYKSTLLQRNIIPDVLQVHGIHVAAMYSCILLYRADVFHLQCCHVAAHCTLQLHDTESRTYAKAWPHCKALHYAISSTSTL